MRQSYLLIFIVILSILTISNALPSKGSTTVTVSVNSALNNKVFTSSIIINNNTYLDNFIKTNGFSGSGSSNSPYLIDNLQFNVQYSNPTGFNQTNLPLLTLENTNRYLIIRNCTFDEGIHAIGLVYLQNVSNVQILQNIFNSRNILSGLVIMDSIHILVKDNTIINNYYGIWLQNLSNLNGSITNLTDSSITDQSEISNNYFANNNDGIFSVNQNYILIHDNYFKNNTDAGIDIFQSFNETFSDINHNIFDSNGNGIIFYYYTFGFTYIFWNDFYNQNQNGIFFYGNYTGLIYNNNFIYSDLYLVPNAVCSLHPESNISLDNGTTGNYFADFQGNTTITNYVPEVGFTLYHLDLFPLKKPVDFNITINGKLYLLPVPPTNNFLSNNLLIQTAVIATILVIIGLIFVYYNRKKSLRRSKYDFDDKILNQIKICSNCGTKQASDSLYCSNCGHKI